MNLVPIYGAIFWGWTPFSVVLVYWLESLGIVGTTSVKLLISKGDGNRTINIWQSLFYAIKHTALLLFYLIFIFVFLGIVLESLTERKSNIVQFLFFMDPSFRNSMLLFFLIKVGYFYVVYVRQKIYLTTKISELKKAIFPRIITIHLVIILGFFAAFGMTVLFEQNLVDVVFAVVFVSIKSIVDFFTIKSSDGDV
jgi:hypothetical protein